MAVDNPARDGAARRPRVLPVRLPGERRSMSRSATRALDVLEYFGQVRRPLRAIEISGALELHPSTTNQLLKTMVDSAHLTFDARTKMYLPSPRLVPFSGWMLRSYGASEQLHQLLWDVEAVTGGAVTLTTPNDLFMQIIDWAGTGPGVERTERGLRAPMFGTAVGMAYLMTLAEPEIRRLAYRGRLSEGQTSQLLGDIERACRKGIALGHSVDGQFGSLAVPLRHPGLPAPLVLGFAGEAERVLGDKDQLGAAIKTAVARWAAAAGAGA